jgi:subtilisin family serine protease
MRRNSVVAVRSLATPFVAAIAGFVLLLSAGAPPQAAANGHHVPLHLRQRAQSSGRIRVIVELARREDAARVLRLLPADSRTIRQFQRLPFVAIDLTSAGLDALDALGSDVVRVMEDTIHKPLLAESVPLIQADRVWAAGYDGTGMTVAILDTGVDRAHPFLAGKVAAEACFSTTLTGITQSFCPNGQSQQIGSGAATPCSLPDCIHGTHVAGIAAGHDSSGAHPASGVAPGAQIMAVQVFTKITNAQVCGGDAPCVGAFASDIVAGLEHVYSVAVAGTYNVAAVNMSLGGGLFGAACDNTPYKPSIDRLRAIGVATVVAAGNDGWPFGLAAPACVSSAVSVGATTKTDEVTSFSNASPLLSLFAPGDSITSSVPGGGYQTFRGTSMAAPHVAGVYALMRQIAPTLSVGTILSVLQQTGLPIADTRPAPAEGATVPRVRAFDALDALIPVTADPPMITSLSPASARAGFGGITLKVFGTGFVPRTVVEFNGVVRPTTVVNASELRASIPGSDITTVGTTFVRALTSTPGGGTSDPLPFAITPPPSLTVSVPIVAPGATTTVTLIDGAGGSTDWLALAAVGAPDGNYLSWTYVGQGVTTRTWTTTMPTAGGAYEFRLFVNNLRVATSPPVTVDPTYKPVPVVNSVSPTSVLASGPGFALTVYGNSFVSSSVIRWNGADRPTTFVNATVLQASIGANDIATAGSALVSVMTPSPGGGVSAAFTVTINPAPVLSVSATSIAAGASVTVTLTNGRGAPHDWLTLAPASAPDSTYVQWTYVGAGVTTRTWTVTLMSAGSYQFRLFLDNGYTRAATSPTVVVVAGAPTLIVDNTTTTSGANITATLINGAGGAGDWLAFASTSAPNNGYLTFAYIGTGVTTRTWTVAAPAIAGTYEFRLFLNNGFTRAATSPPITVMAGAPAVTSLSPSAAPIGGAAFTLTVNGSGFTASSVARWNGSDRATTYVGPTQLTAAIPANDLIAQTSAQIHVFTPAPGGGLSSALPFQVAPPPTLAVDVPTAMAGTPVTVTLSGGFGGATDWLALAQTGAPNSSYGQWVYVGAGVTTRPWTVTLPPAAGTYEFRLFLNGGYTRLATSPSIVVTPAPNPVPVVMSFSPVRAIVGAPITLTVNGNGFTSASTLRWNNLDRPTTFVSETQLRTSLSANDVAMVGTAQVSVASPAPGGGLSAALPFEIAPAPVLTVSAVTAAPGSTVTVTLTGGAGGPTDWLAVAATGAGNSTYLNWTYVGDGVTSRTWTVTMPTTPGTYEFRLFLNNGYVRVATSPPISVS